VKRKCDTGGDAMLCDARIAGESFDIAHRNCRRYNRAA